MPRVLTCSRGNSLTKNIAYFDTQFADVYVEEAVGLRSTPMPKWCLMKPECIRCSSVVLVAATFWVSVSSVHATVTYTDQYRYVTATLTPPSLPTFQATDDNSALGRWSVLVSTGGSAGFARGTQNSNIDPATVDMSGVLSANTTAGTTAHIVSDLRVNFTLDTPTRFAFFSMSVLELSGGISQVGGDFNYPFQSPPFTLIGRGTLPAGDFIMHVSYELAVGPSTNRFHGYSYNFFFIPEPSTWALGVVAGVTLIPRRRARVPLLSRPAMRFHILLRDAAFVVAIRIR